MANAPEIREKLEELLSQQMSLEDFEEWFAPYSWNIHKNGNDEAQKLAYAIEHELSQFDEDCDGLRIELTRILGSSREKAGLELLYSSHPHTAIPSSATLHNKWRRGHANTVQENPDHVCAQISEWREAEGKFGRKRISSWTGWVNMIPVKEPLFWRAGYQVSIPGMHLNLYPMWRMVSLFRR